MLCLVQRGLKCLAIGLDERAASAERAVAEEALAGAATRVVEHAASVHDRVDKLAAIATAGSSSATSGGKREHAEAVHQAAAKVTLVALAIGAPQAALAVVHAVAELAPIELSSSLVVLNHELAATVESIGGKGAHIESAAVSELEPTVAGAHIRLEVADVEVAVGIAQRCHAVVVVVASVEATGAELALVACAVAEEERAVAVRGAVGEVADVAVATRGVRVGAEAVLLAVGEGALVPVAARIVLDTLAAAHAVDELALVAAAAIGEVEHAAAVAQTAPHCAHIASRGVRDDCC